MYNYEEYRKKQHKIFYIIMGISLLFLTLLFIVITPVNAVSIDEIKNQKIELLTVNNNYNVNTGSGGQPFYFHNTNSSDIVGYEGLENIPSGGNEVDENVTVKTGLGNVLIDNYVTLPNSPGLTVIPQGLWRFRTYHYVSSSVGNTTVVFNVYNRTTSGTETLLFTATSEDINALTPTEYLTSYVTNKNYTVLSSDRIVIKVYGTSTHSANINLHFVYQGNVHTSHVQTTLTYLGGTISHSLLSNLNNDDHLQYLNLDGRTNYQILAGGNNANGDLYINGTSSTTKTSSYVSMQAGGGNVCIGSESCSNKLTVLSGDRYTTNFKRNPTDVSLHIYSDSIGGGFAVNSSTKDLLYIQPDTAIKFYVNSSAFVTIYDNSNNLHKVAIGNIAPTAQLDTTGTVRFRNYGAGTATFDAGGNITSVSDSKAKTKINSIPIGLAISQIKSLNPVCYHYTVESGLDSANEYCGFIAGEVKNIIPQAVKTKQDVIYEQKLKVNEKTSGFNEYESVEKFTGTTTDSLDDRAIIAVLVNALKEEDIKVTNQQKQIDELTLRISKLEGGRL